MPAIGCFAAIVLATDLCYSIGSAQGLQIMDWTPQGVVILLAGIGSVGCIVTCMLVPRMLRQIKTRGPTVIGIKRMNLLGLVRPAVSVGG